MSINSSTLSVNQRLSEFALTLGAVLMGATTHWYNRPANLKLEQTLHAHPDHRRGRFHRLASVRPVPGRRPQRHRHGQPHHRQHPQHRAPGRARRFPLHQARRHQLHLRRRAARRPCCTSPRRPARRDAAIDYLQLPIQTLKVGSLGTHNALGLAKAKGARFLLASTSEVYGDPLEHPQTEDYWGNVNPIGPRGVYDEAKRFAEAMTMAYHRAPRRRHAHRPHLQHLRPAHAARRRPRGAQLRRPGPARRAAHRLRRRHADPQLLLRGRPGRRHLSRCCNSDEHEPVNIGNPHEMTILEFAETINRHHRQPGRHRLRADRPHPGRPAAPPARHHQGPRACWAGSQRIGSKTGLRRTDRLLLQVA